MIATVNNDNSFDKYDEPRLHLERLMRVRLVEFDISLRILILLEGAGILTLGDLVKETSQSLRKIRMIGESSVNYLATFLQGLGLSLAE